MVNTIEKVKRGKLDPLKSLNNFPSLKKLMQVRKAEGEVGASESASESESALLTGGMCQDMLFKHTRRAKHANETLLRFSNTRNRRLLLTRASKTRRPKHGASLARA